MKPPEQERISPVSPRGLGFICGGRSWGGLEMNAVRLAGWLHERGEHVVVFADREAPVSLHAESQKLTTAHFTSSFKYGDLVNARRLARLLTAHQVDIIVLHTNRQMFVSVLAKLLSRPPIKLIYQQHMHIGDKKDPFHRWEYGYIDAWVAPLPMFVQRVMRQTSLPPERIETIPFGIRMDRFVPVSAEQKAEARAQLGLPAEAWVLGVVGRLDPKKGQDLLIRAVRRLHDDGIPAYALVVGDSTRGEGQTYEEHLRRLTKETGLQAYIRFRPHTEEIASVYAALDVFVLTSHSETYGMVTIEAMAAGLPVVGSNDGGTMEIIEHERNGLLFTPLGVDDLTRCLRRLHDRPDFAARLGKQARQDTANRYSHEVQCRSWLHLLKHLRAQR